MKITKQKLKEMIVAELGMYQHLPDEPISGDLFGALEEVVEQWVPETEEGQLYEADILSLLNRFGQLEETKSEPGLNEEEKEKWIQGAEKDIEKRGTEGVCTGDKFGSASCRPGTKRYNLAKTFRKMATKRKRE